MEKLDLTPFEKIIADLDSVLSLYNQKPDEYIRDAVVKRFEYTYSMSLKMLQRFLKQSLFSDEEAKDMTFNEIIRTSNTFGLLRSNLETWTRYRQVRNMTAHTYDEEVALEVLSAIPDFKEEVLFLLNKLKEKLS